MSANGYVLLAYGLGLAAMLGYGAMLLVSLARLQGGSPNSGRES